MRKVMTVLKSFLIVGCLIAFVAPAQAEYEQKTQNLTLTKAKKAATTKLEILEKKLAALENKADRFTGKAKKKAVNQYEHLKEEVENYEDQIKARLYKANTNLNKAAEQIGDYAEDLEQRIDKALDS